MQLKQLAAKPQLIKLTLDDEETISAYGEPLDFYTWDRQPMDVFLKVASSAGKDFSVIIEVVRNLVLDEEGLVVIKDDMTLPSDVLMKVVNKIIESLGK